MLKKKQQQLKQKEITSSWYNEFQATRSYWPTWSKWKLNLCHGVWVTLHHHMRGICDPSQNFWRHNMRSRNHLDWTKDLQVPRIQQILIYNCITCYHIFKLPDVYQEKQRGQIWTVRALAWIYWFHKMYFSLNWGCFSLVVGNVNFSISPSSSIDSVIFHVLLRDNLFTYIIRLRLQLAVMRFQKETCVR